MFRKILPPILVALTFLLDTVILPVFVSHWMMPLVALITVHVLGMQIGRTNGTLYGMICGLLVDITVSTPLGLMTMFYGALGYAGGWFARHLFRRINRKFIPLIAGAICFGVFEIGMAFYAILISATLNVQLLTNALIRLALDVALAEGLFIVYEWLIQPDWSRFARR